MKKTFKISNIKGNVFYISDEKIKTFVKKDLSEAQFSTMSLGLGICSQTAKSIMMAIADVAKKEGVTGLVFSLSKSEYDDNYSMFVNAANQTLISKIQGNLSKFDSVSCDLLFSFENQNKARVFANLIDFSIIEKELSVDRKADYEYSIDDFLKPKSEEKEVETILPSLDDEENSLPF